MGNDYQAWTPNLVPSNYGDIGWTLNGNIVHTTHYGDNVSIGVPNQDTNEKLTVAGNVSSRDIVSVFDSKNSYNWRCVYETVDSLSSTWGPRSLSSLWDYACSTGPCHVETITPSMSALKGAEGSGEKRVCFLPPCIWPYPGVARDVVVLDCSKSNMFETTVPCHSGGKIDVEFRCINLQVGQQATCRIKAASGTGFDDHAVLKFDKSWRWVHGIPPATLLSNTCSVISLTRYSEFEPIVAHHNM